MDSTNMVRCENCGGMPLVVHGQKLLCVECFMAQVVQSREQTKLMQEVKPLSFDELQGISMSKTTQFIR